MEEIISMEKFLEMELTPFIHTTKNTRVVDLDHVRASNSKTSLKRHIERGIADKIRLQFQSDYNLSGDWMFDNESSVLDARSQQNRVLRNKAEKTIKREIENGPLYHFNKRRLFDNNSGNETRLLVRENNLLDYEEFVELDEEEEEDKKANENSFLFHSIMFMGSMLEKLSKDEIVVKKYPKEDIIRLRKVVDVALQGTSRIFSDGVTPSDLKATSINVREYVSGLDKFWHRNKNIAAHMYMHKKAVKIGLIMNYLKMSILDYLNSFWRIKLKGLLDVESIESEDKDIIELNEVFRFGNFNDYEFFKKNNMRDKNKPITQRLIAGSLESYLDYNFWMVISLDERTSVYPVDFVLDFLKTIAKRIVLTSCYCGESPLAYNQIDKVDYMLNDCTYDVCNILFHMEMMYAQDKLKYYKFEKNN